MPVLESDIAAADTSDSGVVIGLVNNMPDAALQITEQQFRRLLSATPFGHAVRFRLFFLPEIPRSDHARRHLSYCYEPISALWRSRLDGLIVTGAEPRTAILKDEVYWGTLTKLVDWAEKHTVSTIWSCLAAHAAVHHLSGIHRRALGKKLSGVFDCRKVTEHPIMASVPSTWEVPHSRHNELPDDLLPSMEYQLLSMSARAGVDMFIRQQGSLFVFLNGHPEYHADALFREYRRDVIRFLKREQEVYPDVPNQYFNITIEEELAAFQRRALLHRDASLAADLPVKGGADERLPHRWDDVATLIFSNWLSHVAVQDPRPVAPSYIPAAAKQHEARL